jgi:hypothetical protein
MIHQVSLTRQSWSRRQKAERTFLPGTEGDRSEGGQIVYMEEFRLEVHQYQFRQFQTCFRYEIQTDFYP